ncbi:MAG: PVC-type heme-binding CxxCH protein [Blastopirellula sp. JB062]
MTLRNLFLLTLLGACASTSQTLGADAAASTLQAPAGYTVETAASSDLIAHPLMADFDEQGRLYVAANCGQNLPRAELEKQLPNFIRRLEDVDGDGVFDKATTFVDKLTFPQGCLWHAGSLYVASSGAIWKFTDADDDGVAEQRVKLVGDFGYTGNAADIHGPFLGPEGRLYWCEGRHGHEIKDRQGKLVSKGKAARIFSCRLDGEDVRTYCAGGMDNPVEILFTPSGEMLGTVNLLYAQPRGDCLVHWQHGGTYPRADYVEGLKSEFVRTGDLLSEVYNFGHVAVSGLCRLRQSHRPASGDESLLVTQFNTNRVVRVDLQPSGSTFSVRACEDFLVSPSKDFHPTDVLQDADGSLLVIDTGGWFRIGCPQSESAKPDVRGAIYRIRPTAAAVGNADLTTTGDNPISTLQTKIWSLRRTESPDALAEIATYLKHREPAVRQTAARALLDWPRSEETLSHLPALAKLLETGGPHERLAAATVLAQIAGQAPEATPQLLAALDRDDNDPAIRHALILGLIQGNRRDLLSQALLDERPSIASAAAIAIEQLRRPQINLADQQWLDIPAASLGKPLTAQDREKLLQYETDLPAGEPTRGERLFRSPKLACDKCHQISGKGGQVGPDLTTIGRSRGRRDLLEAILYPNATFARGFAPYLVMTDEGKLHSGIILGENQDELHLGVDKDKSVRIANDRIEAIRASDVSIMPPDFHQAMSQQELADLIAYLQSQNEARRSAAR